MHTTNTHTPTDGERNRKEEEEGRRRRRRKIVPSPLLPERKERERTEMVRERDRSKKRENRGRARGRRKPPRRRRRARMKGNLGRAPSCLRHRRGSGIPEATTPSNLTPPPCMEGAVAVKERGNNAVEVPSLLSSSTGELASPPSMVEPMELSLLPFLQSPPELCPCQAFGRQNGAAVTITHYRCQSYSPASLSPINCRSSGCIRVSSVRLTVVVAKVRRVSVVVDDCCGLGAYGAMELTVVSWSW
ncbi:hypothetical protein PIB30_085007 [Stylosanthes scabra]|uniref:Uncharacterized protein n=1 Tax=Stylosanthes scabra TaxID=79078 RepID=A0ABU6RSW5_9FABA|nr:hypothetical protein [Stylosanthes scabra]